MSWLELKWDGFRALVSTENGFQVRSRRDWNMTGVLPELRALPAGLVLDGELVAWNGSEPYFPLVCRPKTGQQRFCSKGCRERADYRMRGSVKRARYGWLHQRIRSSWAPLVATGGVKCARCRLPLLPGEPWDLGHDDDQEGVYSGPEHRACNRATSGRNGRNGTRRSSWHELEERVSSGRVRCGRCGWLIDYGDDWQSSDEYGPEHGECRGTPPFPPPFEPRIWSHNWWGDPE